MADPQPSAVAARPQQQTAGNPWQTILLAMAAIGMLCVGIANLLKSAERPPAVSKESGDQRQAAPNSVAGNDGRLLILTGKTQPAPGHIASIATMQIHPVDKVLIAPGDRVKAGQTIVELDRDEPEADVRARQAEVVQLQASLARLKALPREEERDKARAELEAARARASGAREHLTRVTALLEKEAIAPGQELQARTDSLDANADERAAAAYLEYLLKAPIPQEIAQLEAQIASAQAELESVQAELEHYTLHAPIDGVVSWLSVSPGTVTRPGTAAWGEILDIRELDVRAEITAEQADSIDAARPATITMPGGEEVSAPVVFIGPAADPQTGLIPVLVRVSNPLERLRAHVNVRLQIPLKENRR
jgi:multidrug resistance efflux pump